ncbi:MAG: hypothetical protein ACM31L_00735 [Actinomycetota bacterium]
MRLYAILVVLATINSSAWASCERGATLPPFNGKRVVLADDVLFFRTNAVATDFDGSPASYGRQDQGLEDICNGLAALEPPKCRGAKQQGECYDACRRAFRAWDGNPTTIERHMCSIGLGGSNCSPPRLRLQNEPRQDWLVSETAVRVSPPDGTPVGRWIGLQDAQIDPFEVSYFVIPGSFRNEKYWDATPGDLGVLVDTKSRRAFLFIVGDTGGALDEGSAHLVSALKGQERLATTKGTSALGKSVERVEQPTARGDFRVAIFRHTSPRLPTKAGVVLNKTAAELPGWIGETAGSKLAAIGGIDRVLACTE